MFLSPETAGTGRSNHGCGYCGRDAYRSKRLRCFDGRECTAVDVLRWGEKRSQPMPGSLSGGHERTAPAPTGNPAGGPGRPHAEALPAARSRGGRAPDDRPDRHAPASGGDQYSER
jgi:hypothetical protein